MQRPEWKPVMTEMEAALWAQESAYAAIKNIRFKGMQFRQDIGNRGLTRNR